MINNYICIYLLKTNKKMKKQNFIQKIIILGFLTLLIGTTSAKTYYVSLKGNNTNSGLTKVKSWRTLTYAAGSTSPVIEGDTVFVEAGNYGAEFVVFSKNGTPTKPIVFQGYKVIPNDQPVLNYVLGKTLDSTLMPLYNGGNRANGKIGFNLIAKSYIIINNFQITNYKYGITTGAGHHLTINNVNVMSMGDIQDNYNGNGIQLGLTGTSFSNYNSITNCLVVNSAAEGISVNGSNNVITNNKVYCNEGIMGSGNNAATDYYILINGNFNSITNCYTERVGNLSHYGHGIGFKYNSSVNTVIKCKSVNMSEDFYVRHRGAKYNKFINCVGIRGSGFVVRDGASNNTFESCVSDSTSSGIRFCDTSEDGGAQYAGRKNIFKNCIIKNSPYGIYFDSYDQISRVDSNFIVNCNFNKINFLFRSNKENVYNLIINCIFTNIKNLSTGSFPVSVMYIKSVFYLNGFMMPIGSGNFSSNPLFLDMGSSDFHLQSSSPCINYGAKLPYVNTDFDGIIRPQGSSLDIGAFEYH